MAVDIVYYFSIYICWWQNETLKRNSSKNFQYEWRWSLLRAKQQVSMPLDMDNVNHVEIFTNGQNSCESVRKSLSENTGTGWQQGSWREDFFTFKSSLPLKLYSPVPTDSYKLWLQFRWVIHTGWGGQTKVFQPLCLCIIINACLYSNILDCFSYSAFIKKYRRIEAGIRTQSNPSEENMCVKLTSWAHKSPNNLLLATKPERRQPQLFLQTQLHLTSGHPTNECPSITHSCRHDLLLIKMITL